jgi:hypothetical protein
MPRGSFSRTVARAAASGGSRSYRARRPFAWYGLLALIIIGGCVLVGFSRNQKLHASTSTAIGPGASANWNVAVGFDICGTTEPDLPASTNASTVGIRTYGDGLINIVPAVATTPSDYEGKKATLGNFVSHYSGLTLTSTSLKLPGSTQKTWTNGESCTGKLTGAADVQVKVWSSPTAKGKLYTGNPADIHLDNRQMITVAFVPKGATIPEPVSKSSLPSA